LNKGEAEIAFFWVEIDDVLFMIKDPKFVVLFRKLDPDPDFVLIRRVTPRPGFQKENRRELLEAKSHLLKIKKARSFS
jgi:hypothetical protein